MVAFGAGVLGCGGSDGDPCKEPDDCESGLMCCKPQSGADQRGTCEQTCMVTTPRDAGSDAGGDAGSTDARVPDASEADGGRTDAASRSDAGELDAGD